MNLLELIRQNEIICVNLNVIIFSNSIHYNFYNFDCSHKIAFKSSHENDKENEMNEIFKKCIIDQITIDAPSWNYNPKNCNKNKSLLYMLDYWNHSLEKHKHYDLLLYLFDYINNSQDIINVKLPFINSMKIIEKINNKKIIFDFKCNCEYFYHNDHENININIKSMIIKKIDKYRHVTLDYSVNLIKFITKKSDYLQTLYIENFNIEDYYESIYDLPNLKSLTIHNNIYGYDIAITSKMLLLLSHKLDFLKIKGGISIVEFKNLSISRANKFHEYEKIFTDINDYNLGRLHLYEHYIYKNVDILNHIKDYQKYLKLIIDFTENWHSQGIYNFFAMCCSDIMQNNENLVIILKINNDHIHMNNKLNKLTSISKNRNITLYELISNNFIY